MKQFKEYLKLRGWIYQLLAYGFYMEPDEAYICDLKASIPVLEKIHEGYPDPAMEDGLMLLRRFIESAERDLGTTLSDYENHFALVFLSPGAAEGQKSIVPHESVYLSPKGWVMQEQRDEVLRCLCNEGLGKDPQFKEPEDHISAELNFMSLLSRQARDAMDKADDRTAMAKLAAQSNFLEAHLLKWVPRVCNDLFNFGQFGLYRALANLTAGFVRSDDAFLSDLLDLIQPR